MTRDARAGSLVGVHQTLDFNGYTLSDQHTPNMFAYTGNVAVSPWGSSRRFVPFVTGGLGGLTMFDSQEANLGVTSTTTFLTGNVGGGAKWFANRSRILRTVEPVRPPRHGGSRPDLLSADQAHGVSPRGETPPLFQ